VLCNETTESLAHFLGCVKRIRDDWFGDDLPTLPWFRGQQRSYWNLQPKLYRDFGDHRSIDENDIERDICEEFMTRAPILSETKPASNDAWEWYFLMQHYGAPTRLLDWTEGALIALYFAVKDNRGFYDSAVWMLDPYDLNVRTLRHEVVIPPSAPCVSKSDRRLVAPWMPAAFTAKTNLPKKAIAIYPTHIAKRISTQRSCFTVHGSDANALDNLEAQPDGHLLKIVIPSHSVQGIQRELTTAGIDEITVFPDLDGLSRSLAARYRSDETPKPHKGVLVRLKPSKMPGAGVGVFAIVDIKKDTPLFEGENEEMLWISKKLPPLGKEIRRLYHDFAIFKKDLLGCPKNFNVLTMAWYLNEPARGEKANTRCDPTSYDFYAAQDIKAGEELKVRYSTYSDPPTV
jgi:hypothetical protein